MFWRNWSWPIRVLFGAVLGFVAFVTLFVSAAYKNVRYSEHYGGCRSNLKQIGLGLIQYTQDYDEKFPPVAARGSAFGWADGLQPYLKSTQLFQCPQQNEQGQTDPHLSGYTDYWFNARLSKHSMETITNPANLIAGGDGNDGTDLTDARYSIPALPSNWINDENSPLYRHFGTANYLFGDGHVKAMKPLAIGAKWSQSGPSFEPTKNAR